MASGQVKRPPLPEAEVEIEPLRFGIELGPNHVAGGLQAQRELEEIHALNRNPGRLPRWPPTGRGVKRRRGRPALRRPLPNLPTGQSTSRCLRAFATHAGQRGAQLFLAAAMSEGHDAFGGNELLRIA